MFGDYSEALLRSGILELKAGNREAARRYLDRAIYMSSDQELMAEAWYWMSQVTDDEGERRRALENCLANDMQHVRARRALAIVDGKLKADEIIDPNAPMPTAGTEEAEAQRFTCPRCGGRMVYAPDGRSLTCEYCLRHQAVSTEQTAAGEKDFVVALATRRGHSKPLREQVLRCQGCGAEFILPAGTLSFTCAYCGSAHVVMVERLQALISPDGIIPHVFDQQHAGDVLGDWLEGLGVEPNRPVGPPRGLYLPAWTFELTGAIRYRGEITRREGDAYADLAPRKEHVEGSHPVALKVSVVASRRASAPFVRLLSGFELSRVQPYDARFLAAWPAELNDVSMAEASLEARSQAYAGLKQDLPSLLSPVRISSTSSAGLMIDTFRLDLLPVWMVEVVVEGRGSIVLINGQSGAVSGETLRPSRKSKRGMSWLRDLLKE